MQTSSIVPIFSKPQDKSSPIYEGCISEGDVFMRRDALLLDALASDQSAKVHFYRWSKLEMSLGHFSRDLSSILNSRTTPVWPLSRRPTGGGIMIHGRDFCFSLLIPASHKFYKISSPKLYEFWHRRLLSCFQDLLIQHCQLLGASTNFIQPFELHLEEEKEAKTSDLRQTACFTKKSLHDGVLSGKKILGSAIRRTKSGILHQFCLQLALYSAEDLCAFLKPEIAEKIIQKNIGLFSFLPEKKQKVILESPYWYELLNQAVLKLFSKYL